MFAFTKVVKLSALFRKNPNDLVFLPVSIIFGYFHGLIKLYALFTLNMVCSELLLIGKNGETDQGCLDFMGQSS